MQIPRSEHPDMVGMVFDHNKAPGRAPAGKGLISTLWQHDWGCRQWDRDDTAIVANASAAQNPVRALYSRVPRPKITNAVAAWNSGDGRRMQNSDTPHVSVATRITQAISGGFE